MARVRKLALSTSAAGFRERALGAVRPGVEALLLAAVALGCAQAGWSVLTPSTAGASNTETDGDGHNIQVSDVVSPFAPNYLEGDAQSHAIAALLSGVQLSGVRVSTDAARSGAVLTLSDGAQHAFSIGQEISSGVVLSKVGADYVLVSYAGGQQQITMSTPRTFSFARAMMGLDQAPGVAAPAQEQASSASLQLSSTPPRATEAAPTQVSTVENAFAQPQPIQTSAAPSAPPPSQSDVAWLQTTLTQTELQDGQPHGWRVAEPLPQIALSAGLQSGDVIVAVNGAGPADRAALLTAMQSQRLELAVQRGDQRLSLTIEPTGRT